MRVLVALLLMVTLAGCGGEEESKKKVEAEAEKPTERGSVKWLESDDPRDAPKLLREK